MKTDRFLHAQPLTARAVWRSSRVDSWKEIWDARPHFERVAELWEDARRSIVVVGWQLDSRLRLSAASSETLREKVLRLCDRNPELHFYLLLWDHPIFYIPQREWLQTRVWEELHPRVHLVFDNHHPMGASHHEKLMIVDGQTALVGSTDLCDERWDSPRHLQVDRTRSLDHRSDAYGPYHELGLEISGPACLELLRHVQARWSMLSTLPLPTEAPPTQAARRQSTVVHLSRTHSELDEPVTREVEFLFESLIRKSSHRLWLEGQYFWSERIAHAVLERMKRHVRESQGSSRPLTRFEVTLILADNSQLRGLSSQMIPHQTRLIARLQSFARHHPDLIRLEVFRPFSGARPIYVHSKILLVDDRYLAIGSANFSERALRLDSEIMVTIDASDEAAVEDRQRLQNLYSTLQRHWSFPIQRRAVDAVLELEMLFHPSLIRRCLDRIPWAPLIDPSLPFFYRTKRRLRSWLKRPARHARVQLAAFGLAALAGALAPAFYAGFNIGDARAVGLAVAMSLVWILPVPLLPLAAATAVWFPRQGAGVVVLAWWSATFISTAWGRAFPGVQLDWMKRNGRPLLADFGQRRFGRTLLGWARPLHSAHLKLLSQSHYFTPGPWILLIHAVLAPSLIGVGASVIWSVIRWFENLK